MDVGSSACLTRPRHLAFVRERMKRVRYDPVMKFEREASAHVAYRMTSRGNGGWSWPLASGKLGDLTRKLVRSLGTDDFFELL